MSTPSQAARDLYSAEPVRVIALLTSAVVFAATQFGFVLPEESVTEALGFVVAILFGGEAARRKVSPSG